MRKRPPKGIPPPRIPLFPRTTLPPPSTPPNYEITRSAGWMQAARVLFPAFIAAGRAIIGNRASLCRAASVEIDFCLRSIDQTFQYFLHYHLSIYLTPSPTHFTNNESNGCLVYLFLGIKSWRFGNFQLDFFFFFLTIFAKYIFLFFFLENDLLIEPVSIGRFILTTKKKQKKFVRTYSANAIRKIWKIDGTEVGS